MHTFASSGGQNVHEEVGKLWKKQRFFISKRSFCRYCKCQRINYYYKLHLNYEKLIQYQQIMRDHLVTLFTHFFLVLNSLLRGSATG